MHHGDSVSRGEALWHEGCNFDFKSGVSSRATTQLKLDGVGLQDVKLQQIAIGTLN